MAADLSGNWTKANTDRGTVEDGGFVFDCPGCKFAHVVRTKGAGPVWNWDGDRAWPTFSPSLLVTITASAGIPAVRCHSFIEGGVIRFLADCTHPLAGRAVPIEPWSAGEDAP